MSAHRDLYPQADPQWLSFMDDIERMSQERSLFGAICTIFYEATCFGGDLGPNGNCLSGTDEGIVHTQAFFDRWVRRVAETVYAEDEERKGIGRELRKMASGPLGISMLPRLAQVVGLEFQGRPWDDLAHNALYRMADLIDPLGKQDSYKKTVDCSR